MVSDCAHNNEHVLTDVPATVPVETSHLLLGNNKTQTPCKTPYYFPNLQVLDLSWNSLHTICQDVFDELSNSTELDLSNNKLSKIPNQLQNMINLEKLILTGNLSEDLPKSIQDQKHLKTIKLSGITFRCDCDRYWMTGWLIKSISIVENPKKFDLFLR